VQKEHADVVDEFAALHAAAGIPDRAVQRHFGGHDTLAYVDDLLPRHSPLLAGSQVTDHTFRVAVTYRTRKTSKTDFARNS